MAAHIIIAKTAPYVGDRTLAARHLNEVDVSYAWPTSMAHFDAELAFAKWTLKGRPSASFGPSNFLFEQKARGSKAAFYAQTGLADCLNLIRDSRVRIEYAQRVIAGYESNNKSDLQAIQVLKYLRGRWRRSGRD